MSADTMTTNLTTAREAVAGEVRAEMARRRLSGRELARRTGKNQAYWSRRMTGEVAFDVDDLLVLSGYLGVPIADLFRGVLSPAGTTQSALTCTASSAWGLAA